MAEPRPPTDLAIYLRRLGVAPGAVVMVHASLKKIGPVEGRAAGVVRALDLAVGETGTLLMSTGAQNAWAWVNERPEAARASRTIPRGDSRRAGAAPTRSCATCLGTTTTDQARRSNGSSMPTARCCGSAPTPTP